MSTNLLEATVAPSVRLTMAQREEIAQRINATINGVPELTAVDVLEVELRINKTESHPVWQKIDRAVREKLKGA